MKERDPKKAAAKRKRDIIITSILLVVFAVSFTKNVLLYKKKQPAPDQQSAAAAGESMGDQLVYVTNLRVMDKLRDDQRAAWDKEWGRDPFEPPATLSTVVKAVNLTLQGVLWDLRNPKAIVNDKTLYKGDTLYGYTVVDIQPRSVILKTGEKTIELSVFRAGAVPEQTVLSN